MGQYNHLPSTFFRPWNSECNLAVATHETVITDGAHSIVSVTYHSNRSTPHHVDKYPRELTPASLQNLHHEAAVLRALARHSLPLQIPEVLGTSASSMTTTYVEGTKLKRQQVGTFSGAEKYALGSRIGSFVAAVGKALPVEQGDHVYTPPNYFQGDIDTMADPSWPQSDTHRALQAARVRISEIHHDIPDCGTRIMGHDDLSPSNYTFTQRDDRWAVRAVYDFANTQPTTPERELRFVGLLGEEAIEGALAGYETTVGKPVSRAVLNFWTTALAVSITSHRVATGRAIDSQLQTVLAAQMPDLGWRELGAPEW